MVATVSAPVHAGLTMNVAVDLSNVSEVMVDVEYVSVVNVLEVVVFPVYVVVGCVVVVDDVDDVDVVDDVVVLVVDDVIVLDDVVDVMCFVVNSGVVNKCAISTPSPSSIFENSSMLLSYTLNEAAASARTQRLKIKSIRRTIPLTR